ncbi:esterase/lipase family protein, partial [Streptomyces sp. NPDC057674]
MWKPGSRIAARIAVPMLAAAVSLLVPAATVRAQTPVRSAVAHTPVVFVHGYNADPGVWGGLREDLKADGYTDGELFSFGYDTHRSVNEVLSGQLAAYIEGVKRQTGASRVDLVAHSFGSLVTRWYTKHDPAG